MVMWRSATQIEDVSPTTYLLSVPCENTFPCFPQRCFTGRDDLSHESPEATMKVNGASSNLNKGLSRLRQLNEPFSGRRISTGSPDQGERRERKEAEDRSSLASWRFPVVVLQRLPVTQGSDQYWLSMAECALSGAASPRLLTLSNHFNVFSPTESNSTGQIVCQLIKRTKKRCKIINWMYNKHTR